ncbi:MAG: UPF0158 family protein [Sulfuricella sp.]|nr:UPF0158 family protein [Sulfuricella sp.]
MTAAKFPELLDAFEFVSAGAPFENSAYVDPDTGAIFWVSSEIELKYEAPDDLDTSNRYIAIPHKNDLNLGRDLVLSFVDEVLPGDYNAVSGFFRSKGAYRRFKDFLASRDMLERWYSFEAGATQEALREWCRENKLELSNG